MTLLTVGTGQQYTTIAAAVAASRSGDTINVSAGTYTNDFLTIRTNLTIQAVGGPVTLVAAAQPPNGKAIITEGAAGITVTLSGLTLTGAKVADNNGAGVRYEGGTLIMNDMVVTGNQEGLLGGADSAGSITITNSTFSNNGAGDGYSHNIYVGAINSFTLTNSTISNAIVGHDVKSRAANNTITGNLITDTGGSASYEIDLPNGGNAVIANNTIGKGANAQNPVAISYGEEGSLYASNSLSVTNNTIVNAYTSHITYAVRNAGATTAVVSGNTFYGWNNLSSGAATLASNVIATAAPALVKPTTTPATPTPTTPTPTAPITGPITLGSGPDRIVVGISEDAWQGDAQYIISVDGQQYGGTQTATASHAAGQSQAVTLLGTFGAGTHTVAVSFLNDAFGGTAATDRNLYVDGIVNGTTASKGATLLSTGAWSTTVSNPATTTPAALTVGSGPDRIVVNVSEDAWQGDAQFTVSVDGRQYGGTLTSTASHAAGQSQAVTVLGTFGTAPHLVGVSFTNDAYAGTAATDRNLYVDSVVSGATIARGATLLSNGTASFIVGTPATVTVGTGPGRIVLQIAEDAWQGDAQFTVKVDGVQQGGTLTASANHAAGLAQQFDILGSFAAGAHKVDISFVNDAWGGTADTDRNLYVNQVGGVAVNTVQLFNQTQSFIAVVPS